MAPTRKAEGGRIMALHLGVIAVLFLAQFLLPAYHLSAFTRIMVLAVYALGYNMLFGYTGLLSLGHAMFFAAGLYGAGLGAHFLGLNPLTAFITGTLAGGAFACVIGLVALRTSGVAFMIVTMMFAQAGYLTILLFNDVTRGDEGFVLEAGERQLALPGGALDLAAPHTAYNVALAIFAVALIFCLFLIRSPIGRVFVAIRENEERTRMLGYNAYRYKLAAVTVSGTLSAMAGAAYALLFAYVGATFASIQYSIFALLWVLLGGTGTLLGPLIGTGLMFYLVDKSSEVTSSYLIIVGAILILLVLFFPRGLLGSLRQHKLRWLP
ncbi:MAG TPA: branched-chain amino acid ABC transporter permease [Terriglobia bacterium]|nr:branched-chain amino acid ABC transporter permease [Terriglobia bacterium]